MRAFQVLNEKEIIMVEKPKVASFTVLSESLRTRLIKDNYMPSLGRTLGYRSKGTLPKPGDIQPTPDCVLVNDAGDGWFIGEVKDSEGPTDKKTLKRLDDYFAAMKLLEDGGKWTGFLFAFFKKEDREGWLKVLEGAATKHGLNAAFYWHERNDVTFIESEVLAIGRQLWHAEQSRTT